MAQTCVGPEPEAAVVVRRRGLVGAAFCRFPGRLEPVEAEPVADQTCVAQRGDVLLAVQGGARPK